MGTLRKTLQDNLPEGFSEEMGSMISYVVPFTLYPKGYHCPPKQPLPFISIASQKNFIALYHFGLYSSPDHLQWFTDAYPLHSKYKLNMGKSCIRFKKVDHIPYALIAELATKMSVQEWIEIYEQALTS